MNDYTLKPFDFQAAVARAGLQPISLSPGAATAAGGTAAVPGGGFQAAMVDAVTSVSQSPFEAEGLQRAVSLNTPGVSLEQTVMAMQKAQVGWQAALQVRNRLAQAYTDIMNMQV